jgi:hypothetical protein
VSKNGLEVFEDLTFYEFIFSWIFFKSMVLRVQESLVTHNVVYNKHRKCEKKLDAIDIHDVVETWKCNHKHITQFLER